VHVTLPIFERRVDGDYTIATFGLGELDRRHSGRSATKLEQRIADELRTKILALPVRDLETLEPRRNVRLEHVRVELNLHADTSAVGPASPGKRKKSGVVPIVLTPRWISRTERVDVACHPFRPTECWPVRDDVPLDEQARLYFAGVWRNLGDGAIEELWSSGKETLRMMAFSAGTRSLLDDLPDHRAQPWEVGQGDPAQRDLRRGQNAGFKVLRKLGTNLSAQAAHGTLAPGAPRAGTHVAKLGELLSASKRKSAVLVGPPGSGKTTILNRAILEALEADGYFLHRNLDRCREVWLVSGKRLIAGMSHVGEWEQRCLDLIDDARGANGGRVVLVVEDLHHFGRIGRSRQSDRCLADLFRGPIARREIVVVGECSLAGMRLLEEEAPQLASLLSPIPVVEATRSETLRLLLHESRALDLKHDVRIGGFALRSIVDLSAALLPGRALPGKAVDLARELARANAPAENAPPAELEPSDVVDLLSEKTGMPRSLLRSEDALDHDDVTRALGAQVMGQAEAVTAMADLVLRIKAGAVDPRRPYGVFLFTGPTGTGKTELAKCLAEYLFGNASRLLRFDMSELAGPDAAARLIGDRWSPEGLLTTAVQQQPFSVVLLDEIEKAHRSVHNLFLQLFEDGQLTDAAGVTAHFAHTVVIMTSNLGGRARPAVGFGDSPEALMLDIARAVREFFAPELWNRIDRIVPFRPLTMEVAVEVAGKELDKMLARRGLAERSIFVSRSPAVTTKVAEVAFRAEDGARSLKRYLESTIGAELTRAIAGRPPAAIQIFHIELARDAVDAGTDAGETRFRVDAQVLDEVPPIDATFALDPLLGLPLKELRAHLAEALVMVRSLEYGGDVDRLSFELSARLVGHALGELGHADAIYELDQMRGAIASFRGRLERALAATDRDAAYEAVEVQRFNRVEHVFSVGDRGWVGRVKLLDRRAVGGGEDHLTKQDVLALLAESYFLRRALEKAAEPGQHAVFVELKRTVGLGASGSGGRFDQPSAGLLEWLGEAYVDGPGEVDSWAIRGRDGAVTAGSGAIDDLSGCVMEDLVLKIVGLCVRDQLELEQGSHVRHALASGPEVVRVRVLPAEPQVTARDFLEAASIDARLVLPVVRKVQFDPPKPGALAPLALEDYAVAWTSRREARSLADALAPLWLYRASRVPTAPPEPAPPPPPPPVDATLAGPVSSRRRGSASGPASRRRG
jgi:ATP-dependent Clp protease ATP-binding subunit ClpA/ATP-dependent Clp protease ATP-binding subunit ClpC